jgi:hypothetical protein
MNSTEAGTTGTHGAPPAPREDTAGDAAHDAGPHGTGRLDARPADASPYDGEAGARAERRLFEGDTGRFGLALRQTLVRLLRGPYLDGSIDATVWQLVLDRRTEISAYVAELFLRLDVDTERKIAVLVPVDMDAPHTTAIVPRKPLRREETLLALRLRLLLDTHSGSGPEPVISRAGAREILEEHRHPGTVDDKRLEELTDSSLARLLALKLILPTELENEYKVSGALAMALPFDTITEIPDYLAAIDRSAGDPAAADLEPADPEPADPDTASENAQEEL